MAFKTEPLERDDIISIVGAAQNDYLGQKGIMPVAKGGLSNVLVRSGAGEYDGGDGRAWDIKTGSPETYGGGGGSAPTGGCTYPGGSGGGGYGRAQYNCGGSAGSGTNGTGSGGGANGNGASSGSGGSGLVVIRYVIEPA